MKRKLHSWRTFCFMVRVKWRMGFLLKSLKSRVSEICVRRINVNQWVDVPQKRQRQMKTVVFSNTPYQCIFGKGKGKPKGVDETHLHEKLHVRLGVVPIAEEKFYLHSSFNVCYEKIKRYKTLVLVTDTQTWFRLYPGPTIWLVNCNICR